jgi:hypothetical protein
MTRAEQIFKDIKVSLEKHQLDRLDRSVELSYCYGYLKSTVQTLCFELEQKEQEITSLRAELLDIQKEMI